MVSDIQFLSRGRDEAQTLYFNKLPETNLPVDVAQNLRMQRAANKENLDVHNPDQDISLP